MDEYQEQRQNEIGIADVFRILLKRIKLLIAVLLAGAVIGGLFGYFTYKDDKYYGAEVKYEISIIATRNVFAADGTVKKEDGKAPNYVYKDQHISMLIDHLNSDTFATEVLKNMEESAGAVKAVTNADGDIDISSMLASGDKAQAEYAKNYLQWLTKVKNCISFYFDYDTNPNSFYMKVSVRGDASFAAKLLATAEKIVPLEVSGVEADEANGIEAKRGWIIVPDSTDSRNDSGVGTVTSYTAQCNPMTVSYSHLLNPGNARKKAILFGTIFGLGALIIACVAVVVADNADERLRDYDKFSKAIGIPVLGVVPSIELLSAPDNKQKKKEEKNK